MASVHTNTPVALAQRVGFLALVCFIGVGCSLIRSEGQPRSPVPLPSPPSPRSVYFIPIGDFSVSDLDSLVAHYQAKFDLTVTVTAQTNGTGGSNPGLQLPLTITATTGITDFDDGAPPNLSASDKIIDAVNHPVSIAEGDGHGRVG